MDSVRAVIYARYSSHAQKDASIEQQLRECREYADKNGITVVGEYCDHAITGKTDRRPQFQKMIKDAQRGRFQLVLTWKVDRFARNRYDAATYKARLKRYGVRVIYAKESIPDGPEGILLESILEGSAEYYSANLSQNIRRGMMDNARACKVNNGGLPLGYCKGPDGCYAIEPAGAAIVREIFGLYADGLNVTQIIDALNARGLKTSRGNVWNKNSLRTILKNERYTGVYLYGDVRIEGGVPQIITKELFAMVQDQVEKTRRAPASSWSEVDYLLTGKLFCGRCGNPMIGDSGTGKSGAKYNYYTCARRKRERACEKASVGKDFIERLVVTETVSRVLVDDVIEQIADAAVALQERERDSSVLDSLTDRLSETRRAIKNLMTAIEQGIITPSTKARMDELEADRAELEDAIEVEKIEKPTLSREQLIYWMERFKTGSVDDEAFRASIIELFISAIYLYDDELRIVYNYGTESSTLTLKDVTACTDAGAPGCSALALSSPCDGGAGDNSFGLRRARAGDPHEDRHHAEAVPQKSGNTREKPALASAG